jgi:hypothetical protein
MIRYNDWSPEAEILMWSIPTRSWAAYEQIVGRKRPRHAPKDPYETTMRPMTYPRVQRISTSEFEEARKP